MTSPTRPSMRGRPGGVVRGGPGFTLIEMLVALAVLAFALATLVGTQASTVRMLALADQMQIAAMLVRGEMQAIEEKLEEQGFDVGIVTDDGDFTDDGYPDYEWDAEIDPVEITDDAQDQFVANIQAELFGTGTSGGGSLSGSAAVSQYLPMIIGQVPEFINQVGQRTRKITLTVTWVSVLGPQMMTVTEYYTVLQPPQGSDTTTTTTSQQNQDLSTINLDEEP